ncbi:MAG: hypothetical protein FWG34_07325 [Oscillospiraceae bacterium]|nr:hypothetical protein [Oscillospiraceae bacterium]
MKKDIHAAKKIAMAAILSSLGVIFLALGSIIEILDLSSAAIAGFLVVVAVIELGAGHSVMIYFAISIFSVLLLPNKFPAVFFMFFGGLYPIFKYHFERFHPVLAWALKFSTFNVFLAFMILSVNFLVESGFLPPLNDSYLSELFGNLKIFIFLVANFTFLLYDIAMTRIINLYIIKIRKIIGLKNYF